MANQPGGAAETGSVNAAQAIARRFVEARLMGRALPGYPGQVPETLEAAYAIQDEALALWPDRVAGWKIGRIPDAWTATLGAGRLAGPIFDDDVQIAPAETEVELPVFVGGFAAVEAEFVFRIARDAPADRTDWTKDDAAELVDALLIGVEAAGSPLATINALGPPVVVSDFGNNAGLVIGRTVEDWRQRLDALTCETFIDGAFIARGGASTIPGGPLESLRFVAELCARRGRPLQAGQLVSTGAATGIHDIVAGQAARIVFEGVGEIRCRAVPAGPRSAA